MKKIFSVLKDNLSKYSETYGQEIKNNKEVRSKFNIICNQIGIDPVVSKSRLMQANEACGVTSVTSIISCLSRYSEYVRSRENLMEV